MKMLRNVAVWILCTVLVVPVCMYAMEEGPHNPSGLSALNPPSGPPGAPPMGPQELGQHAPGPAQDPSMNPSGPASLQDHRVPMDGRHPGPDQHTPGPAQDPHDSSPTQVTSGLDVDFKEQEHIDNAVDTMNAKSGGNWLLKRVWWEKTEDVYEQIKEAFNKVMDTRMQFISDYNKLNRTLDIFYSEIGIEQGPLRDLLSHAQDLMEKEQKEQGYLNKKEQAFVFKIKGKERDLEQLKLDVKAIQELDSKLDEAFEVLFKQIDVCNKYEQKAWNNFKEIARELNDKEARKLYYDTEGLYKDVQKVSQYISGAFATYFNQTIQSAHDHTAKISSQMNALKHEGIDLVKEAEVLEKDEVPEPKKDDKKTKSKPVKKGWWYRLGERFGKFIDKVIDLIPVKIRVWFGKEVKTDEAEFEKLKKEGNQEYAHLKKEAEQEYGHLKKEAQGEYQILKKDAQPDVAYAKKEAHTLEQDAYKEFAHVEKELGIGQVAPTHHAAPAHHTPSHKQHATAPAHTAQPVHHADPMHHATTMPVAPNLPKAPVHHSTAPKFDPTVAPAQHRPLHIPNQTQHHTEPAHHSQPQHSGRSITQHFQPPHHVDKTHAQHTKPMHSNITPLHVDGAKPQGPLK
ncbi:MAG: hypothetical protein ACJAZS_000607 [Alteromonas naphthalenivorans]|jgi:hypothetical protein